MQKLSWGGEADQVLLDCGLSSFLQFQVYLGLYPDGRLGLDGMSAVGADDSVR